MYVKTKKQTNKQASIVKLPQGLASVWNGVSAEICQRRRHEHRVKPVYDRPDEKDHDPES